MHGGRYPTLKALLLLSAKSLDVLGCSQLHMILRQLHNKNQISNHQLKLQTSAKMLSSQTTNSQNNTSSVLKLNSVKESWYESLRRYESYGSIAATGDKRIGIATLLIPVNGPRNQHTPTPTTSLERPSFLPRRATTATTHDLP